MSMGDIKCMFGFSTIPYNALTAYLEGNASAMEASYRQGYLAWRSGLSVLHDAVDAALAGDSVAVGDHASESQALLATCARELTAFAHSLVELRSDLFDRGKADPAEPLLAREPFFARLDYDAIHRELAGQGAVLPGRVFWDETVARLREGGARGACRLLERHVRELQSDLQLFIADLEAAAGLPLRPMAEALHSTSVAVGRVMTGFTRLVTTCGYVSILCERASTAYEQSLQHNSAALAAG